MILGATGDSNADSLYDFRWTKTGTNEGTCSINQNDAINDVDVVPKGTITATTTLVLALNYGSPSHFVSYPLSNIGGKTYVCECGCAPFQPPTTEVSTSDVNTISTSIESSTIKESTSTSTSSSSSQGSSTAKSTSTSKPTTTSTGTTSSSTSPTSSSQRSSSAAPSNSSSSSSSTISSITPSNEVTTKPVTTLASTQSSASTSTTKQSTTSSTSSSSTTTSVSITSSTASVYLTSTEEPTSSSLPRKTSTSFVSTSSPTTSTTIPSSTSGPVTPSGSSTQSLASSSSSTTTSTPGVTTSSTNPPSTTSTSTLTSTASSTSSTSSSSPATRSTAHSTTVLPSPTSQASSSSSSSSSSSISTDSSSPATSTVTTSTSTSSSLSAIPATTDSTSSAMSPTTSSSASTTFGQTSATTSTDAATTAQSTTSISMPPAVTTSVEASTEPDSSQTTIPLTTATSIDPSSEVSTISSTTKSATAAMSTLSISDSSSMASSTIVDGSSTTSFVSSEATSSFADTTSSDLDTSTVSEASSSEAIPTTVLDDVTSSTSSDPSPPTSISSSASSSEQPSSSTSISSSASSSEQPPETDTSPQSSTQQQTESSLGSTTGLVSTTPTEASISTAYASTESQLETTTPGDLPQITTTAALYSTSETSSSSFPETTTARAKILKKTEKTIGSLVPFDQLVMQTRAATSAITSADLPETSDAMRMTSTGTAQSSSTTGGDASQAEAKEGELVTPELAYLETDSKTSDDEIDQPTTSPDSDYDQPSTHIDPATDQRPNNANSDSAENQQKITTDFADHSSTEASSSTDEASSGTYETVMVRISVTSSTTGNDESTGQLISIDSSSIGPSDVMESSDATSHSQSVASSVQTEMSSESGLQHSTASSLELLTTGSSEVDQSTQSTDSTIDGSSADASYSSIDNTRPTDRIAASSFEATEMTEGGTIVPLVSTVVNGQTSMDGISADSASSRNEPTMSAVGTGMTPESSVSFSKTNAVDATDVLEQSSASTGTAIQQTNGIDGTDSGVETTTTTKLRESMTSQSADESAITVKQSPSNYGTSTTGIQPSASGGSSQSLATNVSSTSRVISSASTEQPDGSTAKLASPSSVGESSVLSHSTASNVQTQSLSNNNIDNAQNEPGVTVAGSPSTDAPRNLEDGSTEQLQRSNTPIENQRSTPMDQSPKGRETSLESAITSPSHAASISSLPDDSDTSVEPHDPTVGIPMRSTSPSDSTPNDRSQSSQIVSPSPSMLPPNTSPADSSPADSSMTNAPASSQPTSAPGASNEPSKSNDKPSDLTFAQSPSSLDTNSIATPEVSNSSNNYSHIIDPKLREFLNKMQYSQTNDTIAMTTSLRDKIPFLTAALPVEIQKQIGIQYSSTFVKCYYSRADCLDESDFRWDLTAVFGSCFTYNFNDSDIRIFTHPGPHYGLELTLYTYREDFICTTDSEGFKISLQLPTEAPFPESGGIYAMPGVVTSTIVSRVTNLKQDDCIEDGIRSDYYYEGTYTVEGCMRSCHQKYAMAACDCADPRYPKPEWARYCEVNDIECLENFLSCSVDFLTKDQCSCKQVCRETQYHSIVTTSSINFGTDAWIPICARYFGTLWNGSCEEYLRSSMAVVNIYYDRLSERIFTEEEAYTQVNFLSDLFNWIGLPFAVDFPAVIEVVFIIVDLIVIILAKLIFGRKLVNVLEELDEPDEPNVFD